MDETDRVGPRSARVVAAAALVWAGLLVIGPTPAGAEPSYPPTASATTSPPPSSPSGSPQPPSPTPSPTLPTTTSPTPTVVPSETPTPTSSVEPTPAPSDTAAGEPTPTETPGPTPAQPQRPATQPAVQTSDIPLGSILIAVAVLALTGLALWTAYRRRAGTAEALGTAPGTALPPPTGEAASTTAPGTVPGTEPVTPTAAWARESGVAFLVALGEAMVDSGDPVTHVQASLRQVADVNGIGAAEIIVLPTALIVSLAGQETVHTAGRAAGTARLRLDQVDAVFDVVRAAENGEIEPADGMARLRAIRATPPAYSPGVRLLGYTVLTVGLALVLRASWSDLFVAGLLGAAVGTVLLAGERLAAPYEVFLPVLCAFGVSVTVFMLARTDLDLGVFAPLIAPLVTFLPGALLTTSVIELSTGQMLSGAGRLAAGAMQLVLLALGIVAGAQLVGIPATGLTDTAADPLSTIGPWVGVAVFAVGVLLHNSARRSSFGWILLVLYVAYAGQVVGGLLLGGVLSAFVGALAATPAALFAASQRSGPPTLVTFLPAFWLLVPGALSLVGVTKVLGADRVDGVTSLVTAGATMVGIALGVLLGLAVGEALASTAGRLGRGREP